MLNHALLPAPSNELNEFTTELLNRITKNGNALVETRHGVILRVEYKPITEGDNEEAYFFSRSGGYYYVFEANGKANNSKDYDLIALIDN